MNKIIILTALLTFSFFAESKEKYAEHLLTAESNGFGSCKDLIVENFEIVDNLSVDKYHLYTQKISGLKTDVKTLRFYFSYGSNIELTFGDMLFLKTPNECISYSNISMKFEDTACKNIIESGSWKFDAIHGNSIWYYNSNEDSANFEPINNGNGCLFKFFKTKAKKINP